MLCVWLIKCLPFLKIRVKLTQNTEDESCSDPGIMFKQLLLQKTFKGRRKKKKKTNSCSLLLLSKHFVHE